MGSSPVGIGLIDLHNIWGPLPPTSIPPSPAGSGITEGGKIINYFTLLPAKVLILWATCVTDEWSLKMQPTIQCVFLAYFEPKKYTFAVNIYIQLSIKNAIRSLWKYTFLYILTAVQNNTDVGHLRRGNVSSFCCHSHSVLYSLYNAYPVTLDRTKI